MKRHIFVVSLMCLILCSCGKESNNLRQCGEYDSVYNRFVFKDIGATYEIPTPESSLIMDTSSFPDKIMMCVIDTLEDVCVALIKIDKFPVNEREAVNIASMISYQENPEYEVTYSNSVDESRLLGSEAWAFNSTVSLNRENDSIKIQYYGYILKDMAIVTTCDCKKPWREILPKYIQGLRL